MPFKYLENVHKYQEVKDICLSSILKIKIEYIVGCIATVYV